MDYVLKTVLWSAPVSAAVVTTVMWLMRTWITERLSGSVRHGYDTALESYKADLKAHADAALEQQRSTLKFQTDTSLEAYKSALKTSVDSSLEAHRVQLDLRSHVSKSQFDMEFANFRTLWSAVCLCVNATCKLADTYGRREKEVGIKRQLVDEADSLFLEAMRVCHETSPFVPQEIYDTSALLLVSCKQEITTFYDGELHRDTEEPSPGVTYDAEEARQMARAAREVIVKAWKDLASAVRRRLAELAGEQTAVSGLEMGFALNHSQDAVKMP